METWFYGIDPDYAQIRATNSQIIKDIAIKVSSLRNEVFFGIMIESKNVSLEKKIEKPIIVQA